MIKILILFVIIMAAVCLGVALYAYQYTFYMSSGREEKITIPDGITDQEERKKMESWIQDMIDTPWEEIYITSFDGLKLHGRYLEVSKEAPLQIQFHGYHGSGLREFCGGNRMAREMGFNTLVVTQRAHGKSEGNTTTFGICERRDCLSWITYVCERFGKDVPIYLAGVSMGAATVLMASDMDLPGNVRGIIADCPFSSPREMICKKTKEMGLPVAVTYPLIRLGAFLFGKFDLEEHSAVDAVKNTGVPILLIHGEADGLVPWQMSRKVYDACTSEKYIELFPGADHVGAYVADEQRYRAVVQAFVHECEKM